MTLGKREGGTERLCEAVEAYREALKGETRERKPAKWAGIQHNLGMALATLWEKDGGTDRLEEAVKSYKEALKEWTQDTAPHLHKMAERNLSLALKAIERSKPKPASYRYSQRF
jgi:hypothetical protein